MQLACPRRAEQDHALQVRPRRVACATYKFVELVFRIFTRSHLHPHLLPAAAGAAATGTPAPHPPNPTTPAPPPKPASPKPSAEPAPSSSHHVGEQDPEQHAPQRRKENQQNEGNDSQNRAERQVDLRFALSLRRSTRLRAGELNPRIGRDHLGHAARYQQQSLVICLAAHQRGSFPLKASHLAVGKNRFQPVAYLHACAMILNRVQDQDAAVGGLRADTPFLEEVDGKALDIRSIESVDGYDCDLGVSFLLDLAAEIVHLRNRLLIEYVRVVVDVIRRLEL